MKISFDMSSFASSSSTLTSSSTTTVRYWIISHIRSIWPSLPASFYDFVPFTLAAIMALVFTALLVLLVEDSDDNDESRQPGDGPASSHKSNYRSPKRIVGLAERDNDAESGGEGPSPWDPNADIDSDLKQSRNWMAIQNAKIATSHGYRTTNKRLLASPPQSPAPTPPMLSMAKLIMHRHDQLSKRARSSKAASLPPSPPPTGTSFGSMQYTLKSATIKNEKLALVAFPASEPEPDSSNPSSPPHHDTEKGTPEQPCPSSNTRHARTRSVALPSISLASISSAFQLLQSKPSQDRTVRRCPSSLLEEGGPREEGSSESLPSISESFEATDSSSERRVSESLVELEKGHTSSR